MVLAQRSQPAMFVAYEVKSNMLISFLFITLFFPLKTDICVTLIPAPQITTIELAERTLPITSKTVEASASTACKFNTKRDCSSEGGTVGSPCGDIALVD